MAEHRRRDGENHVAECWRRGMAGEPGWFFAREGPIAIGTPWDDPELINFAAAAVTSTQALLLLRTAEASHGA